MFRSALVALKPDRVSSVVSYALALAKTYSLELGGVAVVDSERLTAGEAVPVGAGAYKVERDEHRLEMARHLAKTAVIELESACRGAAIPFEVSVFEGDIVGELSRAALGYDLLICGHTSGGDASERSLLQSILKHNARPALIVPQNPVSGSSVLLAYDGSFQAARVLATLVNSGLLKGRLLHVVGLHAEYATAAARSATAMNFLRRHGIEAESHPEVLVAEPGTQILETARRRDAGLIAMGAFGKGSVREFFFGSATQTILEQLSIPVLIDH